ncbi:hypothetical protein AB1K83_10515 [Sporosarcina sp. 179-K 3D1 HS]|uniref:hypothetical protein n=1 Tax=Sporosarcina sp. 179-K 3D1 HS TaxID=3232169 RepID=UPI0039A1C443
MTDWYTFVHNTDKQIWEGVVKMLQKHWVKIFFSGIIAGLVLSFSFKLIEQWKAVKVYTLLLNVDYIPFLNRFTYPESVEVGFHLLVSVFVSLVLFLLLREIRTSYHKLIVSMVVSLLIGAAYYPMTVLSERTPQLTDLAALLYWLAGHAVFGLLLGWMLADRKSPSR